MRAGPHHWPPSFTAVAVSPCVVIRQWGRAFEGAPCGVELVILGNNISVQNKRSRAVDLSLRMKLSLHHFWATNASRNLAARNTIVSRCGTAMLLYI